MILPNFKLGDPSLRGRNGGFDSHTLPPTLERKQFMFTFVGQFAPMYYLLSFSIAFRWVCRDGMAQTDSVVPTSAWLKSLGASHWTIQSPTTVAHPFQVIELTAEEKVQWLSDRGFERRSKAAN